MLGDPALRFSLTKEATLKTIVSQATPFTQSLRGDRVADPLSSEVGRREGKGPVSLLSITCAAAPTGAVGNDLTLGKLSWRNSDA